MPSPVIYESTLLPDDLSRLPQPSGYKILIIMPNVADKNDKGLYIPAELVEREKVAAIIGRVVKLGPEAYLDKEKYAGPWCAEGDWVIFRSYAGTRFSVDGQEYRLVNDDTIEAVVADPKGYSRA